MNRGFIEEFIKMYESEPCLWQVKNKYYHNKVKKEAAYARLIEKMRTVDPNSACKDSVIKKINNIRSAYRKEKKKLKASRVSGTGSDDVYEPRLWYFKLLRFLDDQDPRSSCGYPSSDEDDDFTVNNEENEQLDANYNQPEIIENAEEAATAGPTCTVTPQSRPSGRKRILDVVDSITNEVKKPRMLEDRFDIFGKTVALKLRALPKQQMLLAEKCINDILFKAEMDDLTAPPYPFFGD